MEVASKAVVRPYEAVIIMHPESTEKQQKDLFKKNEGIIKNFKGSVNHVDTWGKRLMANTIKGFRKAVYFHTTFESQPEAIAELERTMHINDQVLRYVHVRMNEKVTVAKHLENYRSTIADSIKREKDREAKASKAKSFSRN